MPFKVKEAASDVTLDIAVTTDVVQARPAGDLELRDANSVTQLILDTSAEDLILGAPRDGEVHLGGTFHFKSGYHEITESLAQETAFALTLNAGSGYWFQARVVAIADGVARNFYKFSTFAYRNGVGAATLAGLTAEVTSESEATMDATFTVSGNDLRLSVSGTENFANTVIFTWFLMWGKGATP